MAAPQGMEAGEKPHPEAAEGFGRTFRCSCSFLSPTCTELTPTRCKESLLSPNLKDGQKDLCSQPGAHLHSMDLTAVNDRKTLLEFCVTLGPALLVPSPTEPP